MKKFQESKTLGSFVQEHKRNMIFLMLFIFRKAYDGFLKICLTYGGLKKSYILE